MQKFNKEPRYDHLSADKFWDLVYETAKVKRKRKSAWKELMSPAYADTVRYMAENHMKRIESDVAENDSLTDSVANAYKFIKKIRGWAINSIEKHTASDINIRRWHTLDELHEFIAYQKDVIEDLRAYINERDIQFPLYVSVEDMNNDIETELDDWIRRRARRRGESYEVYPEEY